MHDIMSLHPHGISPEQAAKFYALPQVRAVAHSRLGSGTGAIVMSRTMSLTSSDLCLDPATCGYLVPLSVVPSGHFPAEYTIFALVELLAGVQGRYATFLRGNPEPGPGVKEALALVLGMRDVHAVLEVVGDDLVAVTNRLFALTDHDDIAGVRTFVVPKEHALGFGISLEDKAGKPAKRAASKGATARKGRAGA